ncbi:restriction endonuclease subunit S [Paracoccus methylovorus]|uniref:Restriction endonuclease subunit S n=1 Tax=Paracoccus methylovorus TaxID=2812658 RepID=A0ABX7JQU2_9RHOB|nr:restriction endonuclease subunit S [Paracoccus methylovorus]QRZ15618.1 restriction endonuclease subunit S [Paracoccus methylovorus]
MIKLNDLIEFNPSVRLRKGESAPFIEMAALPTNARDIPEIGAREFSGSGSKFENGDTLFARITPCLENGKGGYVSTLEAGQAAHGSTEFIVMRARSQADGLFVYYITRDPEFRRFAEKQMSGTSGRQRVAWRSIAEYELPTINPSQREAIAATLGVLDDKIELNRRMNATLESMARALFRDWFVDFGPTRAKMEGSKPYLSPDLWALFPDRLDSDGKPEGWEEKPLDEIANFLNGLALQKFPGENEADSLPVIKIAELRNGITAKSNRASRKVPPQYVVQDSDFLFSWSGSLLAKFWTGGEGALNQHLFKVTSDRYPAWFFSEWVQHHLEEFQIIAASKATTMGHIQRGHLKAAKTICPPDDIVARMGETMAPLIDRIIHNEMESRTLAQTRDLLLPRLMSGELRVAEAESLASKVA